MDQNIYLSDDEKKALILLSEGKTSYEIRDHCKIPLSGYNFFISEIRRKTGIRDTKHSRECREYLSRFAEVKEPPTEAQRWALRLFMEDETDEAIAYQLKMSQEDIPAFLTNACRAAGIFTQDRRARKIQVRQYLTSHYPNDNVILTPRIITLLRGMAAGKGFAEIAEEVGQNYDWVRLTAKEVTRKLQLSARGRDVQRTLIQTFLRVRDAREVQHPVCPISPVTMDDPAF